MRTPLLATVLVLSLTACGAAGLTQDAIDHNIAGAEHLRAGDLERAEARFRLALEFQPGFPEPRANLGLVALARGDLRAAEDHLRGAIGLREDFGEAWGDLGVVLEQGGRDADALAAYERALSIHPGLVDARRDLAWLLARHGRHAEARAQLLRLVELAPDDADASGLLAWCELRLDRPEAAREIAERALALDAEARAPRLVRGILRARAGEYEAALEDLEAVRGGSLSPDEELGREATIRIAAIWTIGGRGDEALGTMEALLERDGDDAAARLVAASAALHVEQWERARHHASEALRLQPRLETALLVLADACAHAGDRSCAADALGRVTARDGSIAREADRIRGALPVR